MKPDLVFGVALALLVLGALAAGELRGRTDPLRVLLLGDSLAVGLSRTLRAELLPRAELTTLAREGESLEGYRRAHPREFIPPGRWDAVLVSFGVNDFAAGRGSTARESFAANVTALHWEAGQDRDLRLVWLVPPEMPALPGCQGWVRRTLAGVDPTIATHAFALEPPALELSPDRIHPTPLGYQRWAEWIAERFRP